MFDILSKKKEKEKGRTSKRALRSFCLQNMGKAEKKEAYVYSSFVCFGLF